MSDDQRGSEGNPAGGPPNPFSREGSAGEDAFTSDPPAPSPNGSAPPPAADRDWAYEQPAPPPSWPTYPPVDADPIGPMPGGPIPGGPMPGAGHSPYPASPYQDPYATPPSNPVNQPPLAPSYDPQATGPYGAPEANPGYPPAAPYGAPPASYGSNPYEVNPYQPSYGGYSPYGAGAGLHPKANTALIFGIIGMVLLSTCVGGLVGIGGIVNGRTARAEIDADPQRYTGRSAANWGFGLGVASTILAGLGILLFILLGVTGEFG